MVIFFRIPNCVEVIGQCSGVYFPRRPPKSPGEVKVVISILLTDTVMSEGQTLL